MIGVVVVDDQAAVRLGLGMHLALELDITVIGEANHGEVALKLVEALSPDVMLMDVEMPHLDGIAATAALRERTPQSAVVMLSLHDDVAMRVRAAAAGARAFVAKHDLEDSLLAVIRRAAPCANDHAANQSNPT